jgi:hypothetical protein
MVGCEEEAAQRHRELDDCVFWAAYGKSATTFNVARVYHTFSSKLRNLASDDRGEFDSWDEPARMVALYLLHRQMEGW